MTDITQSAKGIYQTVQRHNAKLVLATKTHFSYEILSQALIHEDIIIAENRIQEAEEKWDVLKRFPNPKHFIGTLQKNKVRKAVRMFDMLECIDSFPMIDRIDRIAKEEDRHIKVLLAVNISKDEHKTGMTPEDISSFLRHVDTQKWTHVQISGLFTILKNGLSQAEKHEYYKQMKTLFRELKKLPQCREWTDLSMGMSGDYNIALEEGATMVRVGQAVFGSRK